MVPALTAQDIQLALEGKIGKELASSEEFSKSVARMLNEWTPNPADLAAFSRRLEEFIFQEIYARLGRGMRYRSHDGTVFRIYMEDLPEIADRCLAVLLPRLPVSPELYTVLYPLAFDRGSYAAMLTLYRRYALQLGEDNLPFIRGILSERAQSDHLPAFLFP